MRRFILLLVLNLHNKNCNTLTFFHFSIAVKKEDNPETKTQAHQKSIPIALLAVFLTLGLVGLLAAAVKCGSKRISREIDNVSIASSEISNASCTTIADTEVKEQTRKSSGVQQV